MRALTFAVLLVGLGTGCSETIVDDPNKDPSKCDPTKYPCGPYGYAQDSIIEDINFVGKIDPGGYAGTASYDSLAMQPVSLSQFFQDKKVKYIFMAGAAGWCGPCKAEQPGVKAAQVEYEAKGVRFLEALMEGAKGGVPSVEADINKWATDHDLHLYLVTDPQKKVFQFAPASAFPVNMVIDRSTMKIVDMRVGQSDASQMLSGLPGL